MEASQRLLDEGEYSPTSPNEKVQRFYEEGQLNSEMSDSDDIDTHLTIESEPKSKFMVIMTRVLIVLGVILLFTLPLILFTFVKPVRSIFRIIATKIGHVQRGFVTYLLLFQYWNWP